MTVGEGKNGSKKSEASTQEHLKDEFSGTVVIPREHQAAVPNEDGSGARKIKRRPRSDRKSTNKSTSSSSAVGEQSQAIESEIDISPNNQKKKKKKKKKKYSAL
eukprot:Trichotokara_eunicae@DN857_c0_g1_i1.p1